MGKKIIQSSLQTAKLSMVARKEAARTRQGDLLRAAAAACFEPLEARRLLTVSVAPTAMGLYNTGDQISQTFTLAVTPGPIQITSTLPVASNVGQSFSGAVAKFTQSSGNLASGYAATINWGDGEISYGTVSGSAGSYTVNGTHTYLSVGTRPVSVGVQDLSSLAPPTPTAAASLNQAAYGTSAVAGPDGKLYVFGGTNNGASNKVQVFDRATSIWSTGPSMPNAAFASSALQT